MRIIRYLKNCKVAVLLIVCLLVVQAFTDLALPHYTSDIVDVGIQQSGVEHAATDEMTAKTHDEIAMMLPVDDEQTFRDAYTETDDGTYKLNDQGKKEQEELDRMVALPLVAIHYSSQIPDLDLDQVMQAYEAGAIDKQKILDMLDEAKQHMGDMGDSIVDQQAIAAAKAEYESLGYNLSDMQMGYLVRIGLLMLGLAALGMVAAVLVGFIASRTAAKVGATLRSKLFRRVVSFSDAEVQSFSAASLITRGTNDIQLVQMVTVMLLRMVLYAPILAIGGIIMVSRTNLAMSWIIILAVAVIFVLIMVLMRVALPKFQIMQTLIDRVNLVSREILTGLPVIRAFDRQPYEEKRFDEASTKLMKTQLFTNRVMTFMMPLMMLIMNGVSVLIVWVGGGYIDNGTIQTGDLIAFITYAMVIIMSFLMIGMISIMLPRADVAAQRVNEVLETKPTICDPAADKARDAELRRSGEGATIAFNDVSFRYGDSKECVLEHIDFTAEPGKTTALIGSTGSGKSTVIKLIERFYDVTEGSVTIDGVDVRDVRRCASSWATCRRRRFCSQAPSSRTWPTRTRGCPSTASGRPSTSPRRRNSSPRRRKAWARACRKAARTCRAASASAWPSPVRWPPRRAPTCSTTASRRSTTRPTPRCARSCTRAWAARPWSSWRSASRRCCMPTASWCWTTAASWARARTRS